MEAAECRYASAPVTSVAILRRSSRELHHVPVVDLREDCDLVDELVYLCVSHQLRPLDGDDALIH